MAKPGTGTGRTQRQRDKLRAAGLRPIQIWVPDTRASDFARECARQAQLVRDSEDPVRAEAWFDLSDKRGWTA